MKQYLNFKQLQKFLSHEKFESKREKKPRNHKNKFKVTTPFFEKSLIDLL